MENLIKTMPQKVEEALACGQTLSDMEGKDYLLVKQDLKKLFLDNFYKNVDVHFFGSRLMGLANEKSDADIFVDVGENSQQISKIKNSNLTQFRGRLPFAIQRER